MNQNKCIKIEHSGIIFDLHVMKNKTDWAAIVSGSAVIVRDTGETASNIGVARQALKYSQL